MIKASEVISFPCPDEHWARVKHHANNAYIDGKNVMPGEHSPEQSLIGQAGEWAGMTYMANSERYYEKRRLQDKNPGEGDGGGDLCLNGRKIDIKCSLMRKNPHPFQYHLIVRPDSFHPEKIYLHCLLKSFESQEILLTGWARGAEFEHNHYLDHPVFTKECWVQEVPKLHSIAKLKEHWDKYQVVLPEIISVLQADPVAS